MSLPSRHDPRPADPVLAALWEQRRDIRRLGVATVFLVFASLVIVIAFVVVRGNDLERLSSENREAIRWICSTTYVLDELVVAAGDAIELNLDAGVYTRLEAEGTLPEDSTEKAEASLAQYRRAHVTLQNTEPCQKVE